MTTTPSPGGLPWPIYLLTLAQAFNLTAAVISVTIAALAHRIFLGRSLSDQRRLAWMGTNMMMLPLCFAGILLCWKTFAGANRRA
ncbi:hypothetical protein [Verminephrobacter eiseniae]|uniref:hypothetical protein n=1 Tax=Verminephrobacter eiseniae TaxID=364317 RepID=UPI002237CB09|nr:hypothetical protein [Verminephrobacter eiseniae]